MAHILICAECFERDHFGDIEVFAALLGRLDIDTVGAEGLGNPGLHSTDVDEFYKKMVCIVAKKRMEHGGNKWNGTILPDRHMDVQREKRTLGATLMQIYILKNKLPG